MRNFFEREKRIDNRYPFVRPFEDWSEEERVLAQRYGLTNQGLVVYRQVTRQFGFCGGYISPIENGFFGLGVAKWNVGREVFDCNSDKAKAGYYAATFDNSYWAFDESPAKIFRPKGKIPTLLLLLMPTENCMKIEYGEVRSTRFFVLDKLDPNDQRARLIEELRPVLGKLKSISLKKIGSTARSWDEVIKILLDG